jgi:hypothetical protein
MSIETDFTAFPWMCPQCNCIAPLSDKFCSSDGTQLVGRRRCGKCSRTAFPLDKFCRGCGRQLVEQP